MREILKQYGYLRYAGKVASPEDHRAIVTSKATLEAKLESTQNIIEDLRRQLEEAQSELKVIEQQISDHASLVSPLRRIPPDILENIFAFAIPSSLLSLREAMIAAPWVLLPVCKYWHDVCLESSRLWSQIYIDSATAPIPERPLSEAASMAVPRLFPSEQRSFRILPYQMITRIADLLQLQLQRSRGADLVVTIQTRPQYDYAQPFLRIILPHLHRVVHLRAPYHILARTPVADSMDRLARIEVDYSEFEGPNLWDSDGEFTGPADHEGPPTALPEDHVHLQNFCNAPKIVEHRALLRRHWSHPITPPVQLYRPESLTSLFLSNADSTFLLPCLPFLGNLQELGLDGGQNVAQGIVATGLARAPRILLPKLVKIALFHAFRSSLSGMLLESIIAPALTHLTYRGPFVHPSLKEFLLISSPALRTFELSPTSGSAIIIDFFVTCSACWTELQTLRVFYNNMGPGGRRSLRFLDHSEDEEKALAIIRLLTRSDSPPVERTTQGGAEENIDIFPSLIELELGGLKSPIAPLISMLESRRLPERGVQIAYCRLDTLDSETCRLSGEEQLAKRWTTRNRTIWEADSYIHCNVTWASQHLLWPSDEIRMWDVADHSQVQARLRWEEALQKEPQQAQRLERLLEGGLELWMRLNNVQMLVDEFFKHLYGRTRT